MFLNSENTFVGRNPNHYLSDASEIQIPAGCGYPKSIATSLGNKIPFQLVSAEAFLAEYVQPNSCAKLTVFND